MTSQYEVIPLKEGYSFTSETGEQRADGSITLVKGRHTIVVDTGSPYDRLQLLQGLEKHCVAVNDVEYVIGTHGHSDHIGNLNLFPNATFIVCYDICKGDVYASHDFSSGEAYKIEEDLEVLPTPGHTGSDVSLVVHQTSQGTVVVAGDLFECQEDLVDESIWREVSEHPDKQLINRNKVLRLADWIVPGHGAMFKVPDKYKIQ